MCFGKHYNLSIFYIEKQTNNKTILPFVSKTERQQTDLLVKCACYTVVSESLNDPLKRSQLSDVIMCLVKAEFSSFKTQFLFGAIEQEL